MAVKTEQVEKNLVKLTFEVSREKFEEGINNSYNKNKSKFNIPGFRKGKVTRAIVEKYYTEAVFYDDAINMVLPESYEAALKEANIEPAARPEFDVDEIKKAKLGLKGRGMGKFKGGIIVDIAPTKVPRLIGKKGSMINMIKDKTKCKIVVGQNGLVWVKGDEDSFCSFPRTRYDE